MTAKSTRQAVERWQNTFVRIPKPAIREAIKNNPSDIEDITSLMLAETTPQREHELPCKPHPCFEKYTPPGGLNSPLYGTMWRLGNHGGKMLAELGFRIYRSESLGFFFGTVIFGDDLYNKLWIPLYKKVKKEAFKCQI